MKKTLLSKLSAAVFLFMACLMFVQPVSAKDSFKEGFEDALIKHRSFLSAQDEGKYKEYLTIFYTQNKKKLMAIYDETHFDKSVYTEEDLENYDVNTAYPGFSDMEFASKEIIDDGDYYTFIVKFTGLDKHWKEAVDAGILVQTEDRDDATYMDAESICESCINSGYTELQITDEDYNTLHYDYSSLDDKLK